MKQSWEEMGNDIAAFLTERRRDSASGRKRPSVLSTWKRAPRTSEETTDMMAALGAIYRTDADREWLKVFALSLTDEHSKFYEQYWRERQRALRPSLAAVDTAVFAALPEAVPQLSARRAAAHRRDRALASAGRRRDEAFSRASTRSPSDFRAPRTPRSRRCTSSRTRSVGPVAEQAVRERIAPAEFRAGIGAQLESPAKVRGGAMLLQRAIPELVAGYERHYLAEARITASGRQRRLRVRARISAAAVRSSMEWISGSTKC